MATTIATAVLTDSAGLMLEIGIAPRLGGIRVMLTDAQARLLIAQLRGGLDVRDEMRSRGEVID